MRNLDALQKNKIVIYKSATSDLVAKDASADYPAGSVEGYLSTFDNVDSDGDVIRRGAWAMTIKQNAGRGWPLMTRHALYGGGVLDVAGSIREAKEDERGLWIRAAFSDDEASQAVRRKVAGGHIRNFSAGFRVVNHRSNVRHESGVDVTELLELALVEGTITPFPANTEAVITSAKSLQAEAATIDDPRAAVLISKLEALIDTLGKSAGAEAPQTATDTPTDSPDTAQGREAASTGTPEPPATTSAVALMGMEADLAAAEWEIRTLIG